MRLSFMAVLALSVFTATGCVTRMQNATNVITLDGIDMTRIGSYKRGEACTNSLLGFINWGDNLVTSAARNGKIERIKFIESEIQGYVVFWKFCSVVYGESKGEARVENDPKGKGEGRGKMKSK